MSNEKQQTAQTILDQVIAPAFVRAGLELYRNDDGSYNYDDAGSWTYVELYAGVNGLGEPGIFGDAMVPVPANGFSSSDYGLSCCADDWMECFGDDAISKIAAGQAPF